ncbi:MAG: glutamate carboxypeptidase [Chloroflexota bacterium]|jgi:glutamate carboxypeptidase|nr:glutamate carboxypeptidase [Chloroflexota bacterium]
MTKAVLAGLREQTPAMLAALEELVMIESPSSDTSATAACATAFAAMGSALLGEKPERLEVDGRQHLLWRFGPHTRVLVVGHLDTVWPVGTTARWPFGVEGGRASGPGVFDMKAGLVQALYGLAALPDPTGIALLATTDEELGSITSRGLIEQLAAGCQAVLVAEPSRNGALKIARKGVSFYHLHVTGLAAHASEPQRGGNALLEMADQVIGLVSIARPDLGTTVTPTLASAGSTQNTVPAAAYAYVDVRVATAVEQGRVDAAFQALRATRPHVSLEVRGGANRPPMEESAARDLFSRATRLAEELDIDLPADGAMVGGGSDGNFTAALGVPTLDGLGGVGDQAHAEGEHVLVERIPERAALLAALGAELLAG